MKRAWGLMILWTVLVAAVPASMAGADDKIGFIEQFSLAPDRAVPLAQLIPGTEDYYYYTCLHLQNTGKLDQVPAVLKQWIERHNETARVQEIQNRQALLTYAKDPKAALDHIIRRLGLHFNHQKEQLDAKPNLPTALDPKAISRETLTKRALSQNALTNGFEALTFDWLVKLQLNNDARRHLLSRLTRPDYPNMVELVLADLKAPNSGGFGSIPIHHQLLLSQLEELVKARPDLINHPQFVIAYLRKLTPGPDVDWRNDPKAQLEYLQRLETFANRLAPVHNSLKAHVLYHRLVLDRSQGIYDKDRFMRYIQLPRRAVYVRPAWLESKENRDVIAELATPYEPTMLGAIGGDEPLVRSYLAHFFLEADDFDAYKPYISESYLQEVFAETKVLAGIGNNEQWFSWLGASRYQALKDRIDIDFAFTNKNYFAPDEPVSLEVHVKNVESLIVKVFEINSMNFYRLKSQEIDTDINLDGLVANEEKVYAYKQPAIIRHAEKFTFDSIKGRGTWVVEFIGNGKSSRALVRKGRLRFVERSGSAGQVLTVFDETNRKLPSASVWLAGHEYKADAAGAINVPYSTSPSRQPIILVDGPVATLDWLDHQAETYTLSAGLFVEREQLLKRRTAKLVIRPALYVNGTPVSLGVLEEVQLVISSVDGENVATTKEVADFKLADDRETVYEFQVPENARRFTFTLRAKAQNLSQSKKVDLADTATFALNGIDATDKVEDMHLSRPSGKYVLDLLGKTGESRADRPVALVLKHREFTEPVYVSLQTDARGRITLGELAGIDSVTATGPEGVAHTWQLPRDRHDYPAVLNGQAGKRLVVPFMPAGELALDQASLLELRGNTFSADYSSSLKLENGLLYVDDLPAGDYSLMLKDSQTTIALRIIPGERMDNYVMGEARLGELTNVAPLQIVGVGGDKDNVTIQLANWTKFARVHVIATKYLPEYPLYGNLGPLPQRQGALVTTPKALTRYVEGRDIGDEYRYILERKYAQKYPGNMLSRPSLLLNPWALRKTETGQQAPAAGSAFRGVGSGRGGRQSGVSAGPPRGTGEGFSNLDYLSQQAVVLTNLQPDDKGIISIKRADLGAHVQLHILAADPRNTVYRESPLPEVEMPFLDQRLLAGLDPAQHFAEQKQITALTAGGKLLIADVATSKAEMYDTLGKVYALYGTLSGEPKLAEFAFVTGWNKLTPQQKREKYSKYACHELNFFLARKDAEFFEKVIHPYLANKKDKTFMDHYLLGDDLSGYLRPWQYQRLNVPERVLLGQRIAAERAAAARSVTELYNLLPPDIERFNHLFKTALRGSALETAAPMVPPGALPPVVILTDGDATVVNGSGTVVAGGANFSTDLHLERGVPIAGLAMPAGAAEGTKAAAEMPAAAPAPAAAARPPGTGVAPKASAGAKGRGGEAEVAKAQVKLDEMRDQEEMLSAELTDGKSDFDKRKAVRQFFQKLDKTEEWAENNYYKLPIEQQIASLVPVNSFWRDYANHDGKSPFLSTNLADASRSFTEMMLALAVLDLPFDAAKSETAQKDASLTLTAGGNSVVYHREIKPAKLADARTPILVSQNFFRNSDRYRFIDNERYDKYVTDEFLTHSVHGCQVVITNPTSTPQKLDVLLQIPRGSMPVLGTLATRSVHVQLQPYSTTTLEYYFYFPAAGDYLHFPVHVSKNQTLIAFAEPVKLHAVDKLTNIDKTSWDYISQHGSNQDVLDFLKTNNVQRLNLDRIAWRMADAAFFRQAIDALRSLHAYNNTLWSYGLKHNEPNIIAEYLPHQDSFVAACGDYIISPILVIDPIERYSYQHLEYSPLVNARAHKLGKDRRIVNDRFHAQYHRLMKVLSYRDQFDDEENLSVAYYMFLQDRVSEALGFLDKVNPDKLPTRLQYDYFVAYSGFYRPDAASQPLARSQQVAAKYADYPVERWRNFFGEVRAQLAELQGAAESAAVDKENRSHRMAALASSEPNVELSVEARKINVKYQNLSQIRINYYLMDVELLFSTNPFVGELGGGQFAYIRPNLMQVVDMPAGKARNLTTQQAATMIAPATRPASRPATAVAAATTQPAGAAARAATTTAPAASQPSYSGSLALDLPQEFTSSNVLVEVVADGIRKTQTYFANSLAVQIVENYGQLQVTHEASGKPLAKVYVKVYARMKDGQVQFLKDGYTDLRGKFDYVSLNTNELDNVAKLAILVLSDTSGAVIREAAPPKR
jgi:hypothetical protein